MATSVACSGDLIIRDDAGGSLPIDAPTYEQNVIVRSGDLECLKALRQKWITELQHLVVNDPERGQHLAEALDDLAILIGRARAAG